MSPFLPHFSVVKTNAGNTNKLANMANVSVTEINPPKAIVPLKLDKVKIANPKINTIEVGSYSNSDFEKGINLATNTKTPRYAIADSIAKLVEEDFAKQSVIRTLRRIELKTLTKVNYANRDTAKAFLRKYIEEMKLQKNNPEANSGYYIMTAQTYLKEIDNEQKLIGRIKEIEELIYTLNKPQTFTYVIENI